jgi:hypothetical protein
MKEWSQMDVDNLNKSQVPGVMKDTFKMLYNR